MLVGLAGIALAAVPIVAEWERLSDQARDAVQGLMAVQRVRRGGPCEPLPALPGAAQVELARIRGDARQLRRALDRFEAEAAAHLLRTEQERGRVLARVGFLALVVLGFVTGLSMQRLVRRAPPVPEWQAPPPPAPEPVPEPPLPEPAPRPVREEGPLPAAALETDEHLRVWLRLRVGVEVYGSPQELPESGVEALLVDLDSGPPVEALELRGLPVLCMADRPADCLDPFLELGALGLVDRNVSATVLRQALQRVARGETVLSPAAAAALKDRARYGRSTGRSDALHELTVREQEIFHLMVRGFSNKEIGERLFISEGTVKTHVNRMLRKLELKDRVQVLLYAAEHDLLNGRGA